MTNDIYKYIDKFFNTYLINEINASKVTILNYKDTFKLLFKYIDSECNFKLKDFSFNYFNKVWQSHKNKVSKYDKITI